MPALSSNGRTVVDTGTIVLLGDTAVLNAGLPKPLAVQFIENGQPGASVFTEEANRYLLKLISVSRHSLGSGSASPTTFTVGPVQYFLMFNIRGADTGPTGSVFHWTLYQA